MQLIKQQTTGCWMRDIYDSMYYIVTFQCDPDTRKLVKVYVKNKTSLNPIVIVNTTDSDFYIEIDKSKTIFYEDINTLIFNLQSAKQTIKEIKEIIHQKYSI